MRGIRAEPLHGNLTQMRRDRVRDAIKSGASQARCRGLGRWGTRSGPTLVGGFMGRGLVGGAGEWFWRGDGAPMRINKLMNFFS